jgi:hypothetical protein
MRLVILLALACSFGCKERRAGDVKAATELGDTSTDLTTFLADAAAMAAYRVSLGTDACKRLQTAERQTPNVRSAKLPYKALSSEELRAVADYTGSLFRRVNPALRGSDATALQARAELRPQIQMIASAINRLDLVRGDVFRGANIPNDLVKRYERAKKSGESVPELAFASSSLNPQLAIGFLQLQKADAAPGQLDNSTRVFYLIHARHHGRLIEGVGISDEREVLFPPGTEFHVLAVKDLTDGMLTTFKGRKLPPLQDDPAARNLPQRPVPGCPAATGAKLVEGDDEGNTTASASAGSLFERFKEPLGFDDYDVAAAPEASQAADEELALAGQDKPVTKFIELEDLP